MSMMNLLRTPASLTCKCYTAPIVCGSLEASQHVCSDRRAEVKSRAAYPPCPSPRAGRCAFEKISSNTLFRKEYDGRLTDCNHVHRYTSTLCSVWRRFKIFLSCLATGATRCKTPVFTVLTRLQAIACPGRPCQGVSLHRCRRRTCSGGRAGHSR